MSNKNPMFPRDISGTFNKHDINDALNILMLEHYEKVDQTKNNFAMIGWWVGQIMKISKGHANPQEILEIIKKRFKIGDEESLPKLLDVREYVKELENK